jgi:hypothetical protein
MNLQIFSLTISVIAIFISIIAIRRQSLHTPPELEQNIREKFRQDNIKMEYIGRSVKFNISNISVEYKEGVRGVIWKHLLSENSAETNIRIKIKMDTNSIGENYNSDINKVKIKDRWYRETPDGVRTASTLSDTDNSVILNIGTAEPLQVYETTLYFVAGIDQQISEVSTLTRNTIQEMASAIISGK